MRADVPKRVFYSTSMVKRAAKDIRPGDRVRVLSYERNGVKYYAEGIVIDRYRLGFLVLTDKNYNVFCKYLDYLMGDGVWKI